MRRFALAVITTVCLSLSTSCGSLGSSASSLVGEWKELGGEKLFFDQYGRVLIFNRSGTLVATSECEYDAGGGTVRMPISGGTLVGKLVGKRRMQVTGLDGRRRMFALKDTERARPGTRVAG